MDNFSGGAINPKNVLKYLMSKELISIFALLVLLILINNIQN